MSKKSRAKAKLKRKKEKAAAKAQKRALYESFKNQGINSKSFRARKRQKKAKAMTLRVGHGPEKCGNPGCKRCFGVNFSSFLDSKGQPVGMPQWMWKRWKKQ